ncbi:MAG: hypothetical protein P9M00_10090 [Candidatus Tritonobacter lacicola]|nr:hypothetical protein [Candidatus Tritonobacter lacicola]
MRKAALCLLALFLCTNRVRGDDERDIRREISLLNLVNGLYLTEGQIKKLADLSRRADSLRDKLRQASADGEGERIEAFRKLREELVYGADVPDDIRHDAVFRNHPPLEHMRSFKFSMAGLAEEVGGVLTEGQKQVIADFKPCLTPPRDLKNPERAGQADNSSGIERVMARLRNAPPRRYERIKEKVIDRHIARLSQHEGPLSGEQIDEERRRIYGIIDRAMHSSDADFEIDKKSLAEEFKGESDHPTQTMRRTLARYFLSPVSTRVLDDKLSAVRSIN